MKQIVVEYSYGLIAVSVLTSMIAAYAAFSLADRMRRAGDAKRRRVWLLGGSLAMGIGIWSMHYLGMLAVVLPVDVVYFVPTVAVSLGLAVVASVVVLSVVSADKLGWRQLAVGGLLMATGIGGMHYTGMAAMRSTVMHHYDARIVALSLLVAVVFSTMALWIGFSVRDRSLHGEWHRISAGAVMGLGIAAMHYTAMAAVRYTPDVMPISTVWTMKVDALGQTAVAIAAGVVLMAALGMAALEKRKNTELETTQASLLETQEQLREANAMLSELSIRDGLTGLFNRRHLDIAIETEFRRAGRAQSVLSLLMIDVDHFKAYNDTYGHQQGDECLREVARVLEEEPWPRRGHDCVARYGGEEFAVVLPGADKASATIIAESLREAVLALQLENHGAGAEKVVTVSIGVCSRWPKIGETTESMLKDADTALYVAKGMGRNRVAVAGEMPIEAQSRR